ncbi:MAG: 16S rRNA (guanine(527)-N(7))-methyltransferase RsmG [Ruminococcus sp.]|jgi:16S rRNA (guanine527-N7)-methyltransferase|nr:16S rRNA (guanine(527)-N(7))-methyltransferase RsmG [Ruminococcus sp.]
MLPEFNIAKEIFLKYDLKLTEKQYEAFDIYAEFMAEYNEKVNLTAITKPYDILVKHFLDSAIPLTYLEFEDGYSLLDIGTGAGFPGLPMAIMFPKLKLTLMDANGKKITFLKELTEKIRRILPIEVTIIQARAEDFARGDLRASFDIVTARAVAPLAVLSEYALPYVKVGGVFLALKGASESYEQGAEITEELGGDLADFAEYFLPVNENTVGGTAETPGETPGDLRRLFIIEKTNITPKKYPRSNAQIKKAKK